MGGDVIVSLAGMLTGVAVMSALAWGMVRVFQGPVGQALARRISGHPASDGELAGEVSELRQHVELLQARLTETEERLDFNERLLANRGDAVQPIDVVTPRA